MSEVMQGKLVNVPQTPVWQGNEDLREYLVPIEQLRPFPGNPRKGDPKAISLSLRRFGQVRAILITEDDTIVAGHHVVKAAQLLEWTHIAALPHAFATKEDAADYLIADNNLVRNFGYDEPVEQLSFLEEIERRGSWEGTGYSPDDLEDMRALAERVRIVTDEDYEAVEAEDAEAAAARAARLAEYRGMREVVMLLTPEAYEDFGAKVRQLRTAWETESVADTISRAVEEAAARLPVADDS